MKKAFAPVHNIVTLVKNITAEDLSHRIESVNSHDEIGELADTFNEMIARLETILNTVDAETVPPSPHRLAATEGAA